MKTLILSVDRDDDMGQKAHVESPIVGRRRIVDAATRLGCADPEDSDTNCLFAAVHLYDKELDVATQKGRQLEVAAIAGHPGLGLRADRKIARELEEVLSLSRADEVILVSDGAEDEQIMPILTSRVKVAHVHRTIVRQAPRLEGFYYTMTRLMEDKKFAQRYILPFGIVMLVWGLAFAMGIEQYAWAVTLGIIGLWLVVHAMHWEQRMSRFLADFADGMRSGKVTLMANFVALTILVIGMLDAYNAVVALDKLTASTLATPDRVMRALVFLNQFVPWLVTALLVRTAGILFDQWVRRGRASIVHWTAAFTLVAFGFISSAILRISIAVRDDTPLQEALEVHVVTRLFIGILIAMSGIVLARYVRNFFDEDAERALRD